MSSAYASDLSLALEIVDAVDALTLPAFAERGFAVETKADATPVTEIDRAVELLVREGLEVALPDDAFLGEEFGERAGTGTRRWIVDPIDGTKNFVRGVPVWATLLALLDGDEAVVGVVSAPALGMRWWASKGDGAWRTAPATGGVPARLGVSEVQRLDEASLSYSSLTGWEERGLLEPFLDLSRDVWRTRGYGDFLSYMMVAEGTVDIAAEPELALYDMAALVPVVTEAGGVFTSLAGAPGPHGGDALVTNGHLHGDALERLRSR